MDDFNVLIDIVPITDIYLIIIDNSQNNEMFYKKACLRVNIINCFILNKLVKSLTKLQKKHYRKKF